MKIRVDQESWPLVHTFAISRGRLDTAQVIVVELEEDGVRGRGECVPYSRYHETPEAVARTLRELAPQIARGVDQQQVQQLLPPGSARNGLDCALWDWKAKAQNVRITDLLGLPPLRPVTTAYTLSLDTPERMGAAAAAHASRPLLKCKLGGDGDLERMAAIRENAPAATLIVDANEAWSPSQVESYSAALANLDVAMIEQPLPAGEDAILGDIPHPVALCADESCHTHADLDGLERRYDVINIKLEKTGGLTAALELRRAARKRGLGIMVGCMVGTSLAMAPALVVAQDADFVDLDGPLLIGRDRKPGLTYEGSTLLPCGPDLWG